MTAIFLCLGGMFVVRNYVANAKNRWLWHGRFELRRQIRHVTINKYASKTPKPQHERYNGSTLLRLRFGMEQSGNWSSHDKMEFISINVIGLRYFSCTHAQKCQHDILRDISCCIKPTIWKGHNGIKWQLVCKSDMMKYTFYFCFILFLILSPVFAYLNIS